MFRTIHDCRLDLVAYSVANVVPEEITMLRDSSATGARLLVDTSEHNLDFMPCSAARVSFGNEDKTGDDVAKDVKLMNYLAAHQHMTPFEYQHATFLIEVPLFIRSQIHRHRTFCLAGDNVISFSRPDNGQHYPYRLDRLYKNWNDPKKRVRLANMQIRSVNEKTGEIFSNTITDVVYSGKKNVYGMLLSNGDTLFGSEDHRVFTRDGWRTIAQLMEEPVPVMVANPHKNDGQESTWPEVYETTEWRDIPGWEGKYEVSDGGEVRSLLNTRGKPLGVFAVKKQTKNTQGYACVSLSSDCMSRMFNVHALVLLAFAGPRPDGMEVRHLDGNRLNPNVNNLVYGYPEDNALDRKHHGTTNYLGTDYSDILEIVFRGTEDTYDISVEGPWHNFFANGVVVHNSYNEISRRYTDEDIEFWIPDKFRGQSKSNRQASSDEVVGQYLYTEQRDGVDVSTDMAWHYNAIHAKEFYEDLLKHGVAREIARAVLPQSLLTKFYMGGSLRNWANFIELRRDAHAQYEVQVVANRVAEQLRKLWPHSCEALGL